MVIIQAKKVSSTYNHTLAFYHVSVTYQWPILKLLSSNALLMNRQVLIDKCHL